MAIDPVCGMSMDERTAILGMHEQQMYFFCSQLCKDQFFKDPKRYVSRLSPVTREVQRTCSIAYFSMEVAIESVMPTYSGGLGVLAGDTLRTCADMRLGVVGVTLLYRKGYFRQEIDRDGVQHELPVSWEPRNYLKALSEQVEIYVEGRPVKIGAWQYDLVGLSGFPVPVIFLDATVEGNNEADRTLTDVLYGGDARYRLIQELILGVGGVRMLKALGYTHLSRYHMNEGHSGLLVLELLAESNRRKGNGWDFEKVKQSCVFTTHTPVPAGHDRFSHDLVKSVLQGSLPFNVVQMLGGDRELNMTLLALNMSHYVNGVAKRHGEISREMFPNYPIDSITNGIHSYTWTADGFRSLYNRYIPGWKADPSTLRYAVGIPRRDVWAAHCEAKQALIERIQRQTKKRLDDRALTIGFARRATAYKRTTLVFSDINRLQHISTKAGKLQFVFAGKAHPHDSGGKELIKQVIAVSKSLEDQVQLVYLSDYDLEMARTLVSGMDLWLNTPRKPLEASGTSGMKAAQNGVPCLSVLDGWWLEGHIEGITGWSIGTADPSSEDDAAEAQELYDKLEGIVVPLYYNNQNRWIDIMRHTIALNASFFNTHRMVQQYVVNAYMAAGIGDSR